MNTTRPILTRGTSLRPHVERSFATWDPLTENAVKTSALPLPLKTLHLYFSVMVLVSCNYYNNPVKEATITLTLLRRSRAEETVACLHWWIYSPYTIWTRKFLVHSSHSWPICFISSQFAEQLDFICSHTAANIQFSLFFPSCLSFTSFCLSVHLMWAKTNTVVGKENNIVLSIIAFLHLSLKLFEFFPREMEKFTYLNIWFIWKARYLFYNMD